MGNFIEYNRHPQHKRVGDCVVRAISTAFNKDYLETRKDLLKEAKSLKCKHYSDHDFLAKYMSKCGFRKISFPAVKGEERMKLCEFANELYKRTEEHSGISLDNYIKYFEGAEVAYAYFLNHPTRFPEPIGIEEYGLKGVPQSYVYLGE